MQMTQSMSQADFAQGDSQLDGNQGQLMRELREKTEKVEELSLKIDELYQVNQSMETIIANLQRFNVDLFTARSSQLMNGTLSQAELKTMIAELNKELETFPRQNKNCIEYYEKYKLKFEELSSKFSQQHQTEEQISELLLSLKEKKAKSIEDNFKVLSRNFSAIFKSIVKDGSAQLKLVKMKPAES